MLAPAFLDHAVDQLKASSLIDDDGITEHLHTLQMVIGDTKQ